MKGTVKFFNKMKGWGFVTDADGKDFFVHHSSIVMDGFRSLEEDDIVDFEIGSGNNGREQAVNVMPILTRKMILKALREENLYVETMKDADNVTKYLVVDQNHVLQTSEQGIDFLELAAFTGYSIVEE